MPLILVESQGTFALLPLVGGQLARHPADRNQFVLSDERGLRHYFFDFVNHPLLFRGNDIYNYSRESEGDGLYLLTSNVSWLGEQASHGVDYLLVVCASVLGEELEPNDVGAHGGCRLWTLESAVDALVAPRELPAFLAPPDQGLVAVGTVEVRCPLRGLYRSVAGIALGQRDRDLRHFLGAPSALADIGC